MKIPNKIRVGSTFYDVVVTKEILVHNNKESKGIIEFDLHVIKISTNGFDKQSQEITFLHELTHAIIRDRNINMLNQTDDEFIVEEIARGYHQVILDNPTLFK
jgi:Zn-dependent peptidase ImmA (M78 family)